MASDALLLGRVTYDGFAPVWPHFEGEFADKFNTMPKYVVSSTLRTRNGTTRPCSAATWSRRSTKLKQRYERDIVVHGSPQLAQTLIEHDLVDALHLQVYPVIVGAGKRLFAETTARRACGSSRRRRSTTGSTSSRTSAAIERGVRLNTSGVRLELCRSGTSRPRG